MSDRLPSDHPAIETVRAQVRRHGGGRRIEVDAGVLPADDVVRVILVGKTRYASVDTSPAGTHRWLTGVYASPRHARTPGSSPDLLAGWLDDADVAVGSSVHLDVIEPGFAYGLREAGTRTVYRGVEAPDDSLARIARDAEEDAPGG